MTFPRKETRLLVVGGQRFLWHVSRKYWRAALATVQAEGGGALLHYWPVSGLPSPAEAADVIRFALGAGWRSVGPGVPTWVGRRDDGLFFLTRERIPSEAAIVATWRAARPTTDEPR